MRKIFATVLALVMALSMVSFAVAEEGYNGEIVVWVAEKAVDFTVEQVEAFKAANPAYANMTVTVEPVGEGDAASNMIADVEGGADIFGFAQDQLSRLVAASALIPVEENNAAVVTAENDAGSVAAATLGDTMYAYPMTSDNGYFLYYDTSVISDPSTLEGILEQCETAGKRFYMEMNSGWYQTAFFFGAGCTLTYDTDSDGNLVACNADYASEAGVAALKAMIRLSQSTAFANGSSASNASDYAAIIDGAWDADTIKAALGDNYAATKLPTFTVDGNTYQMGGFGGFKLLGVKPQTDVDKLTACDALAAWLTSGEVQLARYEALEWGPSNLEAQQNESVQSNVALSALASQLNYCIGQGQYPNDYWTLATALADTVIAHTYDDYTDEQLLAVLQEFQDTCMTYVTAAE